MLLGVSLGLEGQTEPKKGNRQPSLPREQCTLGEECKEGRRDCLSLNLTGCLSLRTPPSGALSLSPTNPSSFLSLGEHRELQLSGSCPCV